MQSELEKALGKLCKHTPRPRVHFCGRTDAGVHATASCVHFDLRRVNAAGAPLPPLDPTAILNALNHTLPPARMGAVACRRVPRTFDAKRSAVERVYVYRVRCAPPPPPPNVGEAGSGAPLSVSLPEGTSLRALSCPSLCRRGWLSAHERQRALCLADSLDIEAMRAAASVIVGRHDFSALRSPRCSAGCPVRILDELSVIDESPDTLTELALEGGRCIAIRVRAGAFLRQQVRRIVSVLVEVGRGAMTPPDVEALIASRDPLRGPPAAAAHGLYLASVRYPPSAFEDGAAPPPGAEPGEDDDDDDDEGEEDARGDGVDEMVDAC